MTFTSIVKWLGWCVCWQLFITLARQHAPLRAVCACCHAPACAGKECLASHHKQSLWEFLSLSSYPKEETSRGRLFMDLHTITVKLYCIYVCVVSCDDINICVCNGGHGVTLQCVVLKYWRNSVYIAYVLMCCCTRTCPLSCVSV